MATRSYIGIQKNDKVECIYCHHDGYLDGVGLVLVNCYKSLEKAEALIALGHISSISKSISNIVTYGTKADTVSLKDFLEMPYKDDEDIEYFYLFKDEKWHYATRNYTHDFKPLSNRVILKEMLKRWEWEMLNFS